MTGNEAFAAAPPVEQGGDARVGDVRLRLNQAYAATASLPPKAKAKLDSQGKMFVRDRVAMLFDEGSFVEDGRYANAMAGGALPADGVVTGRGTVDGRPAIVVANAVIGFALIGDRVRIFAGAVIGKRLLQKATLHTVQRMVAGMMLLIGSGLITGLI